MKVAACLRDLEKLGAGIDLLTGEADSLGYRVLCDLTRRGAELLCEVYGAKEFAENWNHGSDGNPHVASAMLSHRAYLDIAPVFLVRTCHTVIGIGDNIIGLEGNESFERGAFDWESGKYTSPDCIIRDGTSYPVSFLSRTETMHVDRIYSHGSGPHVGSRNVHAMSGRVS
jgi:hypothetical protein